MAKNKIQDLRDHLFETIERLKNPEEDETMTIEKAKAIAEVSREIINTVKVEIDYTKVIDKMVGNHNVSKFIQVEDTENKALGQSE